MSPLRALAPSNPLARLLLIVVAACVVSSAASGAITGLLIRSSIDAGNHAQQAKLFVAQVSGCRRQNVRTVAANKNALAEWRYNTFFAQAITQSQRRQSAQERRISVTFRKRLEDAVDSLTWTPLNRACTRNPTTVQLPVRFSARQPTSTDLRVPKA